MNQENIESHKFISFRDVTKKLGQMQYISRFLNPDEKLHEDGTPYFSDIRIEGNPNDYYSLKIHSDDVQSFIKRWFEFKKLTNPLFVNKKLEDFL